MRGADCTSRRRHQAAMPAGAIGHLRDRPVARRAASGPNQELRPTRRSIGRNETQEAKGATMSKLTLKTEGDRHVVVTRRFAASPEAVFRAHTEPKLIQKWMLG